MEQTILLIKVTPFFTNIERKSPSAYLLFSDMGMRNYALGIFGILFLYPMLVFISKLCVSYTKKLTRSNSLQIHYWRTMNKAEVDFVIDKVNDTLPRSEIQI